jgi:hypothetical protein
MSKKETKKTTKLKPVKKTAKKPLVKKSTISKVEKKGMSTGAKVGISIGVCCCVVLLIIIVIIISVAVWGSWKTEERSKDYKKEFEEQVGKEDETKSWQTYRNKRFDFEVKVPSEFSKTESANGDGASFTLSSPPISINVFGEVNTENKDLDQYLNSERASLFKGAEEASEIEAGDTYLDGIKAQERIWEYRSPIDGSWNYEVRISSLKSNTFYTIELIIGQLDYEDYKETFELIKENFKIL